MASEFFLDLFFALVCGLIIGLERELKHKPAGISTQTLVIGAATLFTYLSRVAYPEDPTRITAQIVSGVGFLGAGIILKSENKVTNLTTAASIWYSAAIGMALGFNQHLVGFVATLYAVLITLIPKVSRDD